MKFVEFMKAEGVPNAGGIPVLIGLDHIVKVEPSRGHSTPKTTTIELVGQAAITVIGDFAEVKSKLGWK